LLRKLLKNVKDLSVEKRGYIREICNEYSESSSIFIENHPDYLEQKRSRLEKAFNEVI